MFVRVCSIICALSAPALAAEFVVNSLANTSDASDDGLCDTANDPGRDIPPSGICTLTAALREGERQGGAHRITFAVEGVIDAPVSARTAAFTIVGPITIDGAIDLQAGGALEDLTALRRVSITGDGARLVQVEFGADAFITGNDALADRVQAVGRITLVGDDARLIGSRVNSFQINGDRARVSDTQQGIEADGTAGFISGAAINGADAEVRNVRFADELSLDGARPQILGCQIGFDGNGAANPNPGQNRWDNASGCVVRDTVIGGTFRVTGDDCVFEGNQIGLDLAGVALIRASDCDIIGTGTAFGGPGDAGNVSLCEVTLEGVRLENNTFGYAADGTFLSPVNVAFTASAPGVVVRDNLVSAILGATGEGIVVRDNRVGATADGTGRVQGENVAAFAGGGAGAVVRDNHLVGRVDFSATNGVFAGNRVNTDATGTVALGDDAQLRVSGIGNTIGGVVPADRNVIIGAEAVLVRDGATRIVGNHIGVDITGNVALVEGRVGIELERGGVVIGEDADVEGCAGGCNVIAGFADAAIDGLGDDHTVTNNHIGVGRDGVTVIGGGGLLLERGVGHLVSNNRFAGLRRTAIQISGAADGAIADAFVISGNVIGLLADGTTAQGSTGIRVQNGDGDFAAGGEIDENVVVDSAAGIVVSRRGAIEHPVFIRRNRIGELPDGSVVGTRAEGMILSGGRIEVGGDPADGNVIAGSGRRGLRVVNGEGTRVLGNRIFGSAGEGISLDNNDRPLLNDPLDADAGPNLSQNSPVLDRVAIRAGVAQVGGTLESAPNADFTIEVFVSAACDESGFGEGALPIGRADVRTDADGVAVIAVDAPVPVGAGNVFTATATDAAGNTSEFGTCAQVDLLIVNVPDDRPDLDPEDGACDVDGAVDGPQCSLRAALEEAEARPGVDVIGFELPGAPRIGVEAALPELSGGVVIDGTGQIGGPPRIEGAGLVFDTAEPVELRGLIIAAAEADGVRQAGDGQLTLEAVRIEGACGWGVQSQADVQAPAGVELTRNGAADGCIGGGLLVLGALEATGLSAVDNGGPGLAVALDATLADVRSEGNAGHGIYVQDGLLRVAPADGRSVRVVGNGGAGVRIDSPCIDDDCPRHVIEGGLIAEGNRGWGLVAEGAIDLRLPDRAPGLASTVRDNGEGPICGGVDLLALDAALIDEECSGGGILSAGDALRVADLLAEANFGPGVMALRDIELVRTRLIDNVGDGAHAANGLIAVVGDPAAAEAEVIARGNRGHGLFAGGFGDDEGDAVGLAAETRLELSENGRWGAFARVGISVGQRGFAGIGPEARTIARGNGAGVGCRETALDPGSIIQISSPVDCEGGGLGAGGESVIFQADVADNRGPGIATRAGLTVLDVQVTQNGGDGIYSEFGEIEFFGAAGASLVRGNAGFGVVAEGGAVRIRADLDVADNASAGISATVVELARLDGEPLEDLNIAVRGNGGGPTCFQVELLDADALAREEIDCFPAGVVTDRINAQGGRIEANAGTGIEAELALLVDTVIVDNQGFGVDVGGLNYFGGQVCRNARLNLKVSGDAQVIGTDVCDDRDLDGVVDAVEEEIGDGNADGIPDADQADVATLVVGVDGERSAVTFATLDGGALRQVAIEPLDAIGVVPPEGVVLPLGLFSFRVEDIEVGGAARVEMRFPEALGINSFFKLRDAAFFEFLDDGADGAAIADAAAIITLIDGERGDVDGEANGRISDPGGPAIVAQQAPDIVLTLGADPEVAAVNAVVDLAGAVRNAGAAPNRPGLLVLRTTHGTLANARLGGIPCAPVEGRFECPVPGIEPDGLRPVVAELRAEAPGEATVTVVFDAAMASVVVRFEAPAADLGIEPDEGVVDQGVEPDEGVVDQGVEPDGFVYLDAQVEPDAAVPDAGVEPDEGVAVDEGVSPDEGMAQDQAVVDAAAPRDYAGDADDDASTGGGGGDGDSGCALRPGSPVHPAWWCIGVLIGWRRRRAPRRPTN